MPSSVAPYTSLPANCKSGVLFMLTATPWPATPGSAPWKAGVRAVIIDHVADQRELITVRRRRRGAEEIVYGHGIAVALVGADVGGLAAAVKGGIVRCRIEGPPQVAEAGEANVHVRPVGEEHV